MMNSLTNTFRCLSCQAVGFYCGNFLCASCLNDGTVVDRFGNMVFDTRWGTSLNGDDEPKHVYKKRRMESQVKPKWPVSNKCDSNSNGNVADLRVESSHHNPDQSNAVSNELNILMNGEKFDELVWAEYHKLKMEYHSTLMELANVKNILQSYQQFMTHFPPQSQQLVRINGISSKNVRLAECDPIIIFDVSRDPPVVITANNKFCEIFGYTIQEIRGVSFTNFVHPHYVDYSITKIKQEYLKPSLSFQQVYVTKTGKVMVSQDCHSFFLGDDGVNLIDFVTVNPLVDFESSRR
eukprot:TRINITY_DN7505_c0_g3_i1.p1 TRINITY_DN7505_c0_g3~~TRINITY_DN7505_c0_g3_i1.p1  ORF type:complete len:294 (+),score=47.10 TRINITY_DN7505_c0_g3_i1:94-975(+)